MTDPHEFAPKLSAEDRAELQKLLLDGVPRAEIAQAFGITPSAVTYYAVRVGVAKERTAQGPAHDRDDESPRHATAEPWMALGLCRQTDPDAFFPDKGGSVREAKAVCRKCEVRAECLNYALEHQERFGIWGGCSERERHAMQRRGTPLTTTKEPA